jgi:TonB family protein
MAKFGWHQHGLFLLVLALGCAPEIALPQAQPSLPVLNPVSLDSKQATRLVLNQVKPEYPPLAKLNYIQGHVQVQVEITRDGKVAQAHVVRGHPILAASTLKAVRGWVYRPLQTPSGPSGFLTTVEVKFSLRLHKPDTMPTQAERDLSRQVKPPEVIGRPAGPSPTTVVHMRVLLNDQGQVIDAEPLRGPATNLEAAERSLQGWTFRPAHWGSLPIPWYLDVYVPVGTAATSRAGADPGGL